MNLDGQTLCGLSDLRPVDEQKLVKSGSEPDIMHGIQAILDTIAPGRFVCVERKNLRGKSAISKPVDLQISLTGDLNKAAVAIEVANVNTTQLVGETCRLYCDSCPLKLLILGDRNVPPQ